MIYKQFIENKEQQKIVRDIVQELPNQEKQVLVLYYFEELTLREIGVILKTHLQMLKIHKIHASQVFLMHQPQIFHLDGINPHFK